MCGGYHCYKNALTALNVLFLLVSFVLVATGSYAKAAAIIPSIQIAGGIIACGLFLFILSILGLVATSKHHQVLLFFYIVILSLLFLIQFSVSVACLAVAEREITAKTQNGSTSKPDFKVPFEDIEKYFHCCGWDHSDLRNETLLTICDENKFCSKDLESMTSSNGLPSCKPCGDLIVKKAGSPLVTSGAIGLFFSLIELLGVYLACRFRNQKNPKANPSQFL